MDTVYIGLKKKLITEQKKIELYKICDIFSNKKNNDLGKLSFNLNDGMNIISSIDIIKAINNKAPNLFIINVGENEIKVIKEKKQEKSIFTVLKVVVIAIILFFGSAVAIMNFHADVNMSQVHRNIQYFYTGDNSTKAPGVSIAYSIGILLGFAGVFGIFAKRRKEKPGLLELDFFKHNSLSDEYLGEVYKEEAKKDD